MSLVKHALVAVSVTVLVLRGSRAVEKIGKAFVRLCRRAELPIVASQNPYVAVSLYPEKEGSVVHPSPTGDGDHAQIDPGARTQKKKRYRSTGIVPSKNLLSLHLDSSFRERSSHRD